MPRAIDRMGVIPDPAAKPTCVRAALLRSRLYDMERQKLDAERAADRRAQGEVLPGGEGIVRGQGRGDVEGDRHRVRRFAAQLGDPQGVEAGWARRVARQWHLK